MIVLYLFNLPFIHFYIHMLHFSMFSWYFGVENFDFPTPVVESGGSGAGRKRMCEGVGTNTTDIANSSSLMKEDEGAKCKANIGEYTKIGNLVTFNFLFYVTGVHSLNTVYVTLPFQAKNGSGSSRNDSLGDVNWKKLKSIWSHYQN